MDVYQRRRLVALSALAGVFIILVLLIKSCGGDDESTTPLPATGTSTPPTALTQDAYVSQADEICRETNTSISEIDTSDTNQAAEDQGTAIASELNSLQTLPPPTDGQDQLDSFLQALQTQVNLYEQRTTAVERGDDAAVSEIDSKIDNAEAKAESAASDFGFEACGDFSKTSQSAGGGGGGGGGTEATTETTSGTGGTVVPTTEVPTTTTPPATTTPPVTGAPPTETGTAPPSDGGGTGTGASGGVTP
jgi:hypothetical protein